MHALSTAWPETAFLCKITGYANTLSFNMRIVYMHVCMYHADTQCNHNVKHAGPHTVPQYNDHIP